MAVKLTDPEIQQLLLERKPLPADYRERIQIRPKRGHKERELEVNGSSGSEFRLILRQSDFNQIDFSVILAYRIPKTNQLFRLRRYNGRHEHTNVLERESFYDFHIHMATATSPPLSVAPCFRVQSHNQKEIGHEEAFFRRTDHRLSA